MRFPVVKVAVVAASALFGMAGAVAAQYGALVITQPAADATIHDNEGRLTVDAALSPPLDSAAGDRLELAIDGAVAADADTPHFGVDGVVRGTHTLEVRVLDRDGNILLRSAPVTVYMWQASRKFPNRKGH
jgi:hypothetical protein